MQVILNDRVESSGSQAYNTVKGQEGLPADHVFWCKLLMSCKHLCQLCLWRSPFLCARVCLLLLCCLAVQHRVLPAMPHCVALLALLTGLLEHLSLQICCSAP